MIKDIFISAQNEVYDTVLKELKSGKKRTHWIWFIFPQILSLGKSQKSKFYGICDLNEAKMFMDNKVLFRRYVECLCAIEDSGVDPKEILGDTDWKKLRSSLTLFKRVIPELDYFIRAFNMDYCLHTIEAIQYD
jgi:uncharacterized protein (DUF1810 family)